MRRVRYHRNGEGRVRYHWNFYVVVWTMLFNNPRGMKIFEYIIIIMFLATIYYPLASTINHYLRKNRISFIKFIA